jgi:RimJ/RimL family protein N-acetyltransferase
MDELAPATLVLADGEIALRCWRDSDAAALAGVCRDDAILRWTRVPDGYTEQMARDRIAQAESERRAGSALLLAVVTAQTDAVLGACDLRLAPQDPGRAEIAYMLGAPARGRGVMARAVALLARWAIEERGVARVEGFAHPANAASVAVLRRAGFTEEGQLREYRVKHGRRDDRIVFSLVRGDLPADPPRA